MIRILASCRKELEEFPEEVRDELGDLLMRLEEGHKLSMPASRPMPVIGSGVHELRFRDRSEIYRVIYVLVGMGNVWIIHGFKKKTQGIPQQNIDLAKKRLREVLK